VRANRAYRLIVRRGGWLPASIADPGRADHIEVVEVASGEVLLAWNLPPIPAVRLARALRADLAQLEPAEFAARWIDAHDDAEGGGAGEGEAGGKDWSESDTWV
jgi:hypothetical protein